MGKLGSALILSPFATHPLDAGQRKRAFQTTSLLKEWGFSITFLHYAFETRWYWGHNSEDDVVLREQWDGDVLHFYANKAVGQPPINGQSHHLDEWWDEALEGYINNIFSKRQYDLFVVHNIWLSKAFDFVPHHCMKVLEMHDLFSQRAKEYEATGVSPEFFHCSEKDEVFGLMRADLLITIKQEDADWCKVQDIGNTHVLTIPYLERGDPNILETESIRLGKPLHPGKLTFGMIGSDIHFNRHAVHSIIKELDKAIRETYAPIEFVLAGSICRSVGSCPAFVKVRGFVDHVLDFYSSVDVVMVPMMHGTGVKIKSVEALNHRKPVLFTVHSAEGTGFTGQTCRTLTEMARWASEIALSGIIPEQLTQSCLQSNSIALSWLIESKIKFIENYELKRPSFMHILGTDGIENTEETLLEALIGLSLHKEISSIYRSQGLCIHPRVNEYFLSIPSHPIRKLQSMQATLEAWANSTFAIISFSQKGLVNVMPQEIGPAMIIFDCRTVCSDVLDELILPEDTTYRKHAYIFTPFQAAKVPTELIGKIIVIPLIISRCNWDPHVSQLVLEIKDSPHYRSFQRILEIHSDIISNGILDIGSTDTKIREYNIQMVEQEAAMQLFTLITNSRD